MRMFLGFMLIAVLVAFSAQAQFKAKTESTPSVSESMVRSDGGGLLFGWFDPSRLSMHHSYSLSYMTSGGQGLSLGMYTNSLFYRFSDPLSLQVDVSLIHSPFNSAGDKFGKDISGIYLNRAELNYRPSENTLFTIQFRQLPALYWLNNRNYGLSGPLYGFDRSEEEHR